MRTSNLRYGTQHALPFWLALFLTLLVLWQPVLLRAQPVGIPSIGSASSAELSPAIEAVLGDAIMEQGRRDPTYIDELYINQYLTDTGQRLVKAAPAKIDQTIRVFALRDQSINSFALPGGDHRVSHRLISNTT